MAKKTAADFATLFERMKNMVHNTSSEHKSKVRSSKKGGFHTDLERVELADPSILTEMGFPEEVVESMSLYASGHEGAHLRYTDGGKGVGTGEKGTDTLREALIKGVKMGYTADQVNTCLQVTEDFRVDMCACNDYLGYADYREAGGAGMIRKTMKKPTGRRGFDTEKAVSSMTYGVDLRDLSPEWAKAVDWERVERTAAHVMSASMGSTQDAFEIGLAALPMLFDKKPKDKPKTHTKKREDDTSEEPEESTPYDESDDDRMDTPERDETEDESEGTGIPDLELDEDDSDTPDEESEEEPEDAESDSTSDVSSEDTESEDESDATSNESDEASDDEDDTEDEGDEPEDDTDDSDVPEDDEEETDEDMEGSGSGSSDTESDDEDESEPDDSGDSEDGDGDGDEETEEELTSEEMDAIEKAIEELEDKSVLDTLMDEDTRDAYNDHKDEAEATEEEALKTAERFDDSCTNNYGLYKYSEDVRNEIRRQHCTGIHANAEPWFVDVNHANQAFSRPKLSKATRVGNYTSYEPAPPAYFDEQCRQLANAIKEYLRMKNEEITYNAYDGRISGNRAWRLDRGVNGKCFDKPEEIDNSSYVIDLLVDVSASQGDRMDAVRTQSYIFTRACTLAGIPIRVTSFCENSPVTELIVYREYDDPMSKDVNVGRMYHHACNRDGLAITATSYHLSRRAESDKILIVLSDGEPSGSGGSNYTRTGELCLPYYWDWMTPYGTGVDDMAKVIRQLRGKGVQVYGIFVDSDSEEALKIERDTFGNDFVAIDDMTNFVPYMKRVLHRIFTK